MQSREDTSHNTPVPEELACGASFTRRAMKAIAFALVGVGVALPAIWLYLGRRALTHSHPSGSGPSDDAATPTEPIRITLVSEFPAIVPVTESIPFYVGSTESDKFHVPACRWARQIRQEHRLVFEHREAALAEGYVPCGTCSP